MKAKELREKSPEDLNEQMFSGLKDLMAMRMQSQGQVPPHKFKLIKRGIARIKTILNEKESSK